MVPVDSEIVGILVIIMRNDKLGAFYALKWRKGVVRDTRFNFFMDDAGSLLFFLVPNLSLFLKYCIKLYQLINFFKYSLVLKQLIVFENFLHYFRLLFLSLIVILFMLIQFSNNHLRTPTAEPQFHP